MTKAEARQYYLEKRKALSDAERDDLNKKIEKIFFDSAYVAAAKTIHIFLSMERTREPDTWKLIDKLLPGKRLIVPRINADGTLDHFYYEGPKQLKQSQLGILEPTSGIPARVDKIDLVIAPLAAYDILGNRVGYGKGYYDRFLKQVRPDCTKAGLSFFEPAEKFSDVEVHDVPLDICFTPWALHDLSSGMRRVPK